MRVIATINEQSQPELYQDLATRGSRYRPERLRWLAALGLMVEHGRLATAQSAADTTAPVRGVAPVSEPPPTERAQPSATEAVPLQGDPTSTEATPNAEARETNQDSPAPDRAALRRFRRSFAG